jgi:hypothetical protein
MSYGFYKVLHLISVFGIVMSVGALTLHVMSGGEKKFAQRRWIMMTHGLGMFFAFVAGFGLMARLGLMSTWPLWIWGKLIIWLVFGGIVALIPRWPKGAKWVWFLILILAGGAAYLANFKPT